MSQDQAVFSFELNESLYFEKGQEVDEIRGISLDPDISIQPFNDYISIRGVIELRGEYVRANMENEEQDGISEFADDYHAKRFVEQVMDTEEGGAEFSHRFPVEISVPSYRVENLDEVMVGIDSFDYELSEQRQLAFTSTIAIHGIKEQDETPRDDTTSTFTQDADQTFDFDIKEVQQDFDAETSDKDKLTSPEYPDIPTLSNETESAGEESSPDRWKHKKTQSLAEFFGQKPVSDPEPDPAESSSSHNGDPYPEQNEVEFTEASYSSESVNTDGNWGSPSSFPNDNLPESSSHDDYGWESSSDLSSVPRTEVVTEITDDQNSSASPQINENAEAEANESTDVRYLSDMFRDEEESFSRMRVCIVQEKDTLEMIADRYKISTLQLIKQNSLDDETISEGQLLHIPEKKK